MKKAKRMLLLTAASLALTLCACGEKQSDLTLPPVQRRLRSPPMRLWKQKSKPAL